jgi:plasmid stabilization system protein ParE
MKFARSSPRGIPITVEPKAHRDLRRCLLQLAERHGLAAAVDRDQAYEQLLSRLQVQPRMFPVRRDLTGQEHERVAWIGRWSIAYTVEIDSEDRAVEVVVHRIRQGAPRE